MLCIAHGLLATGQDSLRIRPYRNHISLAAHLTQIGLNTILENKQTRKRIEYNTATATRFGMSFDYRWLAFELFTHLPNNSKNKTGNTRNTGIYGRINRSKFWANIYFQRFAGFYWNNPDPVSQAIAGDPYPNRQDIVNRLFQVSGYYVFRPDLFSNMAAQGENERQRRSGGSFFAGLGYFSNVFEGDSTLVPSTQARFFKDNEEVQKIVSRSYVLSGGYAYTLVFKEKLYATLYLAPGIARYTMENRYTDETHSDLTAEWAFRLESRLSLGYNTDRYFGGIMVSSYLNNQDIGDGTSFAYGFQTLRVYFGRRFALSRSLGYIGL